MSKNGFHVDITATVRPNDPDAEEETRQVETSFDFDGSGLSFSDPASAKRTGSEVERSVSSALQRLARDLITLILSVLLQMLTGGRPEDHARRSMRFQTVYGMIHLPLLDTSLTDWPVRETAFSEEMDAELLNDSTVMSTRHVAETVNRGHDFTGDDKLADRSVARHILQRGLEICARINLAARTALSEFETFKTLNGYTTFTKEVAEAQGWVYVSDDKAAEKAHLEAVSAAVDKLNSRTEKRMLSRLKEQFGDTFDPEKAEAAIQKRRIVGSEVIAGSTERADESVGYLLVDGIVAHFQKNGRGKLVVRESKWTECHCAYIEIDGQSAVFVGRTMQELFEHILAFLKVNGFLNRRLVVLADGDNRIWTACREVFHFTHVDMILDWYHLTHKIYEKLSSGINGTKETKAAVRNYLKALLWNGRVDSALEYLESLKGRTVKAENGSSYRLVKSKAALDDLIAYLTNKKDYIPCYAVRRQLGLLVSSNAVERTNNQLVAERQKNNGMAWSKDGSIAQATITMMKTNRLLDEYIRTGEFTFKFRLVDVGGPRAAAARARAAKLQSANKKIA